MSNVLKRDLAADYRLLLSWRYNQVEMLGLPSLKETRPLRLDYLYVPPRFSWEHRGKETFWLPKALSEHKHLVVLGDPGAGKSTLVKSVTYGFGKAGETSLSRTFGKLLPIPIILRDYRVSQWQNYRDMLGDFIKQLDEKIHDDISVDWLLEFLRNGEAILLFDGVDEVGSAKTRKYLRDNVLLPLLEKASRSRVIITSRIIGYDEAPFDSQRAVMRDANDPAESGLFNRITSFKCCYVAPFNDEDIEQFIIRWYGLREEDEFRRRGGIESLERAIQSNDRVKQLATNPQMLTLMALIHRNLSVLPSGRVKLYDKIVEAYLETIDVYRKLGQYPASLDQMKRWLAHVGWQMQLRRRSDDDWGYGDDLLASRQEVLGWLTEAIVKESDNAAEEAEQFLDFVARRSGLLIPRGVDREGADEFSFIHLTFQEYFAAYYLRGMVWDFHKLVQEISSRIELQHWHETILVLFEMLAEMRGAGDRLIGLLTEQAKEREQLQATAEIYSALLLDTETGVSLTTQSDIANFTLDFISDNINDSIINNLRQLKDERLASLVVRPMLDRLRHTEPAQWPGNFLLVGDDLIAEWPLAVKETVIARANADWPREQTAIATLISIGSKEVIEWASKRLPVSLWLSPIESRLIGQDTSLAELNLTVIFNSHAASNHLLLLAQSGFALSTSTSSALRVSVLARSLDQYPARFPHHYLDQYLNRYRSFSLSRSLIRNRGKHPIRSLIFHLAHKLDLFQDPRVDRELAFYFSKAISSSRIDIEEKKSSANSLVIISADAEWLAFQPDRESERLATIKRLREFLQAKDDWTQLLAINNLITLSAGTPELVAERNRLCDKAMRHPDEFTFPTKLSEATKDKEWFNLPVIIALIFLHEPGDPFLKPEWFDPKREESNFFLTPPREFFALAAEALDPKGETELAKWRK